MIFSSSSFFIMPISYFYFFRFEVAYYRPLKICLYQILPLHLLQCPCKNLLSLSQIKSCLCAYNTALPHFHKLAAEIYSEIYTLQPYSGAIFFLPRYTSLFKLVSVFAISAANNYFEDGCSLFKFGFITSLCFISS